MHFDSCQQLWIPYSSAEINFGKLLAKDFLPYRDQIIISTKAGDDM